MAHYVFFFLAAVVLLFSSGAPVLAQADSVEPVQALRQSEEIGEYSISWTLYGTSQPALRRRSEQLKTQLIAQINLLEQLKVAQAPPREVYQLLKQLQTACTRSGGALNPQDYSLRAAWGFTPLSLSFRVPTPEERANYLEAMNCQKISTLEQPLSTAYFGAGWLIDQSRDVLRPEGLITASQLEINEVAFYQGQPPQARAWKVPIYHPRQKETLIQYFYLQNQALSTLRDATHHFYFNGLRYPDFIDGRTGQSHIENAGAYVLSESALESQLLARMAVVMDKASLQQVLPQYGTVRMIRWQEQLGRLMPQEFSNP